MNINMLAAPLLLLTTAAAFGAPEEGQLGGYDPVSCKALIVSADNEKDTTPGSGKKFQATQISDVRVRALLPPLIRIGPDAVFAFRFTTPKGHLYQTIEIPVSSKTSPMETERRRAGYPFPVKVQAPQSVKVNAQTVRTVEARLLVAGTAIMDTGLYGTWKAEASLGKAQPCSATFSLQP